ncbi:MAG: SH3 domain-containing protein [Candidatus Omnitrophota bacterium]
MGRTKADRVQVRAGQSNNYEVVGVLNKETEVVVLGQSYSWYKVRLPEGARLYIKADYAKLITPETGEITGNHVNIRARPNTNAAIVGQLARGDHFSVQEKAGDWIGIKPVLQASGWIHEDLVEFKGPGVADKLYPDTQNAIERAREDQEHLDRERVDAEQKRAAKLAYIKSQANGEFESEGILIKASADKYTLIRGDKPGSVAAYVEGPDAVLSGFVDDHVVVRGTLKDDPSFDAVKLSVIKINLAL